MRGTITAIGKDEGVLLELPIPQSAFEKIKTRALEDDIPVLDWLENTVTGKARDKLKVDPLVEVEAKVRIAEALIQSKFFNSAQAVAVGVEHIMNNSILIK